MGNIGPLGVLVFVIVFAIVGGIVVFLRRVIAAAAGTTGCPACGATVEKSAKVCRSCSNSL
jgi:hypothetical protein